MMWTCLFVGVVCYSVLMAGREGVSAWIGAAAGVVTWLALMSGYMCLLTIYDWWDHSKHPNRIGVPWWGIAATWLLFAATAAGAGWLWAWVYGGG